MFRITKENVKELVEIEEQCFGPIAWNEKMLLSEMENPLSHFWGISVEGRLIGYCSLRLILDEGHISNIAVIPQFQRKGFGREMLQLTEQFCMKNNINSMTLEVNTGNIAAVKMYLAAGYTVSGVRCNYYPSECEYGRDAYVMWKNLLCEA